MKRKNNLFWAVFLSATMASCIQVLDVTIPEEDDKVVIEGLVTTKTRPFEVKISKTLALGNGNQYPKINNAVVIITDNVGNRDTLKLTYPNSGIYQTTVAKTGVVGRVYYLTVKIKNAVYHAEDKLNPVSPIDSLYSLYIKAGGAFGITKDGNYLFFNSSDPPAQKNYYQYKVFKNGYSVLNPSQIIVYDDRFLAPVIIGALLPGKFKNGDKTRMELYSLSEKAFNFYNGLATQLQSDGGFFSTPPANAPSNLSNGALGFFQASDVAIDSLIVP